MRRLCLALLLLGLLIAPLVPPESAEAQGGNPPAAVRAAFQKMTPEERVGQLFLVGFNGTDTTEKSQIYDLIVNRHVGGVVLSAGNDNFGAAPGTADGAYQLSRNLQEIEWNTFLNAPVDPKLGQTVSHQYVPLFIAMAQAGDGPPDDQILSGLTP